MACSFSDFFLLIGDCWSGMQSSINNYETHGKSKACIARDQLPCDEDSIACVGEAGANFVYELTGKILLQTLFM